MRDSPSKLEQGTQLRYPIYDDRGVLLLKAGASLTPQLADLLERRGIRVVLHAQLEMIAGAEPGRRVTVSGHTFSIGRGPDCDLRPGSKIVSGKHCRVHKHPLGLSLEDLGSTNGTFVNQQRLDPFRPVPLQDGDCLLFGDMAARVRLYAALEGAESDVQDVAGHILARAGAEDRAEEELDGGTVRPSLVEAFRLRRLLDGVLAQSGD